jgi:tRNA(His) guanylyltransferase
VNYFRWRQADATRCCLNGWCYWLLRQDGHSPAKATEMLDRQKVAEKNEMLFQRGINFNDVPLWQRRGVGFRRVFEKREGVDQRTSTPVEVTRRVIQVDRELPLGDDYSSYLHELMAVG